MGELKDYIASRKQQLEEARDKLQAELQPILAELDEIARAERALATPPRLRRPRQPSRPGGETIKGRALQVLTASDRPLTAAEVLEAVQVAGGKAIDRTTFSPQLSRLCAAGLVTRTGMTYRATLASQDQAGEVRS